MTKLRISGIIRIGRKTFPFTKQEVGSVTEAARKAQREYQAEYRKRNPDRVRQWQSRFWERKAQEQKEVEKTNGPESTFQRDV